MREHDEEAVAGVIDDCPAMLREAGAEHPIMLGDDALILPRRQFLKTKCVVSGALRSRQARSVLDASALDQTETAGRPKVEQTADNTEDVFVGFKASTIQATQDPELLQARKVMLDVDAQSR